MFDRKVLSRETVSYTEMRKCVSDIEVLAAHFPDVEKLPVLVRSPLREDRNPSFKLFRKGSKVFYKDFSTGESGDIVKLLSLMWGMDYKETVKNLYDKSKVCANDIVVRRRAERLGTSKRTRIGVQLRHWEKRDINYWTSYGVSPDMLDRAEIYPVKTIVYYTDSSESRVEADRLAYAFVERKEGFVQYKVYQPMSKDKKWISTFDKSVISLWNTLPGKGDLMCVASSVKDALCLTGNLGIPAIAMQGEGYDMSETAMRALKERFTRIVVLYDSDDAGRAMSRKMCDKTGFELVLLPPFEGGKDLSDFYKRFGKDRFINEISKLFHVKEEREDGVLSEENDTEAGTGDNQVARDGGEHLQRDGVRQADETPACADRQE